MRRKEEKGSNKETRGNHYKGESNYLKTLCAKVAKHCKRCVDDVKG
jgi:hypothetical protein